MYLEVQEGESWSITYYKTEYEEKLKQRWEGMEEVVERGMEEE